MCMGSLISEVDLIMYRRESLKYNYNHPLMSSLDLISHQSLLPNTNKAVMNMNRARYERPFGGLSPEEQSRRGSDTSP